MDTEAGTGSNFSAERLEAFSDGVMAVIITIMAFELRAPAGSGLHALGQRLPGLLVYILSFAMVGIYWNNHHHLLRATPRISGAVMWANLGLLFWLSLIPVMTEWLGSYYRDTGPRSPTASSGSRPRSRSRSSFARSSPIAANARGSFVAQTIGSDRKGNVSLVLYVLAIGLAFVSPWIAYALYLSVAVTWFVPDRRLAR